jgi:hypothetical protein
MLEVKIRHDPRVLTIPVDFANTIERRYPDDGACKESDDKSLNSHRSGLPSPSIVFTLHFRKNRPFDFIAFIHDRSNFLRQAHN